MVLLSLQFLYVDVIILADIRTRVKLEDKFNILYVVYLKKKPPITVHCTRNQVVTCHTVSTTGLFGKRFYSGTLPRE